MPFPNPAAPAPLLAVRLAASPAAKPGYSPLFPAYFLVLFILFNIPGLTLIFNVLFLTNTLV